MSKWVTNDVGAATLKLNDFVEESQILASDAPLKSHSLSKGHNPVISRIIQQTGM